MTGNGNQVNLLNLLVKIREITSSKLIFRGFYPFRSTVHYQEPRGVETDRDASNCVTIWTYANLCVKTRRCSTYFTTVAANNPLDLRNWESKEGQSPPHILVAIRILWFISNCFYKELKPWKQISNKKVKQWLTFYKQQVHFSSIDSKHVNFLLM